MTPFPIVMAVYFKYLEEIKIRHQRHVQIEQRIMLRTKDVRPYMHLYVQQNNGIIPSMDYYGLQELQEKFILIFGIK